MFSIDTVKKLFEKPHLAVTLASTFAPVDYNIATAKSKLSNAMVERSYIYILVVCALFLKYHVELT